MWARSNLTTRRGRRGRNVAGALQVSASQRAESSAESEARQSRPREAREQRAKTQYLREPAIVSQSEPGHPGSLVRKVQ